MYRIYLFNLITQEVTIGAEDLTQREAAVFVARWKVSEFESIPIMWPTKLPAPAIRFAGRKTAAAAHA